MSYDLATRELISVTDDDITDDGPRVSGNLVTWTREMSGSSDLSQVMLWDRQSKQTVVLSEGLAWAAGPSIDGYAVAWSGATSVQGSSDIYLAQYLPVDFPGFSDVPPTHRFYTAIMDLASRGIISGYTDHTFGPDDAVIRQQFAKMVVGAAGYPVSMSDECPFTDVDEQLGTDPFYPSRYVAVAASHGITVGKTQTSFDPWSNISRYQVITMVVRAADDLAPGTLTTPPPSYGTWRSDPTHGANAAWAEYGGLLAGLDLTSLSPYGDMPRGEVAQVLYNLVQLLGL